MSTNIGFSHKNNNTTQNFLILTGVALGSIIILIAVAFLCERFYCRRSYQDTTIVVAAHADVHNQSFGLDPSTIANLPTFRYKRDADDGSTGWLQCVICLSMIQEGEEVRQLPICKHLFHQECIDMWFYSHYTCPLCRSVVEAVGDVKVMDSGTAPSSLVLQV